MRYVIIKPEGRTISAVDCPELRDAEIVAGLDPDGVDHGSLARGLGYVIYQFAMFTPPAEQHYFALCGRLLAGPVVLYGYDEAGETIPLRKSAIPDVRWYLGVNDVEAAIAREEIDRPFLGVNGKIMWEWPAPPPKGVMP